MVVGAGVVGLGFGARIHVPGLRRIEGVEVVAVCARRGAVEAADRLGVPSAYTDWRELVADERVLLVSIASPPVTHRPIALEALAAGKAVLCEKPLGLTVAEAEEMAAAASRAGVATMPDFEFREVPAFARAADRLGGGALGDVAAADVVWTLPPKPSPQPGWKSDRKLGGGTLLSLGVHVFDYLEWYVGPVRRVRGRLEHAAGPSADTGCEVELEHASGARSTLRLSSAAEQPAGHVLTLQGSRGTLVLENSDLADYMRAFRLRLDGGRRETLEPEPTDEDGRLAPFAALAGRLITAVREGTAVYPSFEEGLRAQRIAVAVEESDRTEGWVPTT
jgi:predicted dehydrogenase